MNTLIQNQLKIICSYVNQNNAIDDFAQLSLKSINKLITFLLIDYRILIQYTVLLDVLPVIKPLLTEENFNLYFEKDTKQIGYYEFLCKFFWVLPD